MSEVRFKRPAYAVVLNYTKQGKLFRNYMNVYPLSTDSKITHYVAFTDHAEFIDSSSVGQATGAAQSIQAPPPLIGALAHPNNGVVKPAAQILHPQTTQQVMKGPTQLILQGQQTIMAVPGMNAVQGSRQVVYYQAPPPGILPEGTTAMPVLQAIASSPAAIAPRTSLPTVCATQQK
jgi:hypothetical protein